MSKINGFDEDGNMLTVDVTVTEIIPPEIVEEARKQGYPDDKIKEMWEFQVAGCIEYHSNFIYDNVKEQLEEGE